MAVNAPLQQAVKLPYPSSSPLKSPQTAHRNNVAIEPVVFQNNDTFTNNTTKEKNVLRDTVLRYLGYANEFTEAGKTSGNVLAKALNPLAWMTVFSYGITDALNRSIDKHAQSLKETGSESGIL